MQSRAVACRWILQESSTENGACDPRRPPGGESRSRGTDEHAAHPSTRAKQHHRRTQRTCAADRYQRMRYHAWITQIRTLDVLIDADCRDDAERLIRGQLRSTPSDSWIDAATIIKIADSSPQPPRPSPSAPPPRQVWSVPEAAERLGVSRTHPLRTPERRRPRIGHHRTPPLRRRSTTPALHRQPNPRST